MAKISNALEDAIREKVITMLDELVTKAESLDEIILSYRVIYKSTKASNDIKARYARGEVVGFAKYNQEIGIEALREKGLQMQAKINHIPWNKGLTGMQTITEEHKMKLKAGHKKYYDDLKL